MNPDTWIIDHLEAAMARSPVSPFAVARFLVPGYALSFAALQICYGFAVWRAVMVFVLLILSPVRCSRISQLERENTRGMLNSEKLKWRWRIFLVGSLMFQVLALPWWHGLTDLLATASTMLLAAEEHFAALNWTPPPAKSVWDRKMLGGAA